MDLVTEYQLDVPLWALQGVDVEYSEDDEVELQGDSRAVVYVVVKVPVRVTILPVSEFVQLVEVVISDSFVLDSLDLSSSLLLVMVEKAVAMLFELVIPGTVALVKMNAEESVEIGDCKVMEVVPFPVAVALDVVETNIAVEVPDVTGLGVREPSESE